MAAAEEELAGIDRALEAAEGERRVRLGKRREALARRLSGWRDPGAEDLFRRERHELGKIARDALRAELARVAVEAVERARLGLYSSKLEAVLGRPVDVTRLEPAILPAFLFFGTLGAYPANRKGLARLIEDRLEGRPHEWLWTEPAVLAWKGRVGAALPGVVFERWRALLDRKSVV